MQKTFVIALLTGALAFGCDSDSDSSDSTSPGGAGDTTGGGAGDDDENVDEGDGGGDAGTTSTTPDGSDEGNGEDGDDAVDESGGDGGDDESGGFIAMPDGGGVAVECDVWTDDCPEGQKCMPWANDGQNAWNATRCSPIEDNPGQVGDECTVEGSGVSGIDSCDARSMCYYVDAESGIGSCVGFCQGTPSAPSCDPEFICSIVNEGVLTLCRPTCDPLLQDCGGSAACLQATGSQGFTCIIDSSGEGGAAGDPCEFLNACSPGLFCADAALVPNCQGSSGCCTEFCDLDEADPSAGCSAAGQQCELYAEDLPPSLQNVGACVLPQ